MKNLFAPAWLTARLTGVLPQSISSAGKKTPWYRQSLEGLAPYVAAALIAPLLLLVVWKGTHILWRKAEAQE